MTSKSQIISWMIFILSMIISYFFMYFFLEELSHRLIVKPSKRITIDSPDKLTSKIDKKADISIDHAEKFHYKDSTYFINSNKHTVRVKTDEPLFGIHLYIVNRYNESKTNYAIVVTLAMFIIGVIIGFITDFILKKIGLDVKRIEHLE